MGKNITEAEQERTRRPTIDKLVELVRDQVFKLLYSGVFDAEASIGALRPFARKVVEENDCTLEEALTELSAVYWSRCYNNTEEQKVTALRLQYGAKVADAVREKLAANRSGYDDIWREQGRYKMRGLIPAHIEVYGSLEELPSKFDA